MSAVTPVFTVYAHERGKRPRPIGSTGSSAFPTEWTDGDSLLFFGFADLVARTVTYTDIRPAVSA